MGSSNPPPRPSSVTFENPPFLSVSNGSVSCETSPNLSHRSNRAGRESSENVLEKNLRNGGKPTSVPRTRSKSNRKVRGSRADVLRQPHGEDTGRRGSAPTMKQRELPKPLDGTETTNASYVNMMNSSASNNRCISPSKSCNDLTKMTVPPKSLVPTPEGTTHRHSWNPETGYSLQIDTSTTSTTLPAPRSPNSLTNALRSTTQLSASAAPSTLAGMRGTGVNSVTEVLIQTTGDIEADDYSSIEFDLYTVEVKSMLFNIVKVGHTRFSFYNLFF